MSQAHGRRASVNTWTPAEDALLKEWQAKHGNKWSLVSKYLPGRTGQQCAQRWRHKGNPEISRAKWSAEEDEKLRELVAEHGNHWACVARHLPGRTDQQCMGRWRRHLDPAIKYGPWDPAEDTALHQLVQQHGTQWSVMAQHFGNRTPQQCRTRWQKLAVGMQPVHARKRSSARSPPDAANRRSRRRIPDSGDRSSDEENASQDVAKQATQACKPEQPLNDRIGVAEPLRVLLGASCALQQRDSPQAPTDLAVPRRSRRQRVPLASSQANHQNTAAANAPFQAAGNLLPPLAVATRPNEGLQRRPSIMQEATAASSPRRQPSSSLFWRHSPLPQRTRPGPCQLLSRQDSLVSTAQPHLPQAYPASISTYSDGRPETSGINNSTSAPSWELLVRQCSSGTAALPCQSGGQASVAALNSTFCARRKQQVIAEETKSQHRSRLQPRLAAATDSSKGNDTLIHTNALFFWLQLLLLRPLQPVLSCHSTLMASRMQQLAYLSAATFLLFCCPCLQP